MISILRASPKDAPQLTQIALTAKRHWGYPEKWMQLWHSALTISSEYVSENEVWMAVVGGIPVAYYSLLSVIASGEGAKQSPLITRGLLRVEDHPRIDIDSLWLDNLWVLPEYMGQGIGKQLFKHALERSRLGRASILRIEADPNAQSFYERMGAHKVGELHGEVDGQLRVLPIMEIDL